VSMLRDDARLSMPPIPSWFEGAQVIGSWLRQAILSPSASGQFRGILTGSNGLPAVALYQRQGDVSHLNGIHVLEVQDGMLAEITAFMDPAVLRFFDVPATMKSRG
jgi:RNA polymerase sigma-70 factor (ECF subfamily)